jgi:hypothetical protein
LYVRNGEKHDMGKRLRFLFIAVGILTLVFVGLEQGSAAYGTIKSAIVSQGSNLARARDVEAQALVESAKADLKSRGIATQVQVQGLEPTEFPDGSLGAPEPNKPYPLVVTPGYNISLRANSVVYRYWAADGRVVYVGSFVEPTGRLAGVRGLSAK